MEYFEETWQESLLYLNVFVIVFVFLLVRSCFIITLIKSLKGQEAQTLLFEGVL